MGLFLLSNEPVDKKMSKTLVDGNVFTSHDILLLHSIQLPAFASYLVRYTISSVLNMFITRRGMWKVWEVGRGRGNGIIIIKKRK